MFLWPKNFSGTRLSARKGFIDDNVMETIWIASSLCCPGLPPHPLLPAYDPG